MSGSRVVDLEEGDRVTGVASLDSAEGDEETGPGEGETGPGEGEAGPGEGEAGPATAGPETE